LPVGCTENSFKGNDEGLSECLFEGLTVGCTEESFEGNVEGTDEGLSEG
jgi:hypothetical protein